MRVVVTGAIGMVGSSVTRILAGEPLVSEVVGLARRVPDTPIDGVTWRRADMRHDNLVEAFRGADAVVHLAWMIHPAWSASATWAANVGGAERVLRAAAQARVGVLAYASSLGAYAPGPRIAGRSTSRGRRRESPASRTGVRRRRSRRCAHVWPVSDRRCAWCACARAS